MEVRAGFKKTEVGVIPEDWQSLAVGEICGCIVPGRNKPRLFDGDIPWITTPDLENGRPVTTSRLGLYISREEAKSVGSKIVPRGAVLFSCAGELGIVALVSNEIVVNQQLHVFTPTDRIDSAFLLNSLSFRKKQIEHYGTKTAVPYLNKAACNSIQIPFPPLPEQRAISTALSDVDALLDGLTRLSAKKRDLKQATMQQLLSGQTRLPGFRGRWEVKRLGDIASVQKGQLITTRTLIHGEIPVIAGGKQPAYFHATANRQGKTITVSASGASAGYVAFHAYPIFASDCSTISESNSYCIEFLFYALLLRQDEIYAAQTGGAQPHVQPKDLAPISINLPESPAEQVAIAAVLSDMDAELAALEARLTKTRALKQAMMSELLTGKTRLPT